MGIWYNPKLILSYFESKGYTEFVFKTIIQALPLLKLDFEKKRILLGLSSILKVNPYEIPPVNILFC